MKNSSLPILAAVLSLKAAINNVRNVVDLLG